MHIRFPLHLEVQILNMDNTSGSFCNKTVYFQIKYETNIPQVNERIEDGWYSEESTKAIKNKVLDLMIPPVKEGTVITTLVFGE